MSGPVVRVSLLRCPPERVEELRAMMADAEGPLAGLRDLHGCRGYYAGFDAEHGMLSNISLWDTVEDARQMDHFQPMLDLAQRFAGAGATFERPIKNFETIWRIG